MVLFALSLMLVLEGAWPFLAPSTWRRTFRRLVELSDGQLRFVGLSAMIVGLVLMVLVLVLVHGD
jgi:uncharacterized protein YjeT (DUF2065 family)